MTTALPGWRRLAVKLVRHAAAGLSGASPWARAMQCELDYIDDDRAALRWALGCVIASYKLRLAARAQVDLGRFRRVFNERNRRHPLSGARPREVLRQAAVSAALMLVTGVVLLENAGGQTAPPSPSAPVLDETTCDMADKGRNLGPNADRTLPSVSVRAAPDATRPTPTFETPCAGRNAPAGFPPGSDTP